MAKNTNDKGSFDGELHSGYAAGTAEIEEAPEKKAGQGLVGLLSLFFNGFFMIAIAASGYYLYQQEFRPVKDNVDKIRAQLSGEKLQKVQTSLDDHADAIAGIKEQQGTHKNLLQQNVVKLNTLDESLISMSDISFLLQAADDRLRLLGDVRTAKNILTVVTTRLKSNPATPDGLLEAVNNDLKRLSAYQPFDVNQALFSLNALVYSLHIPPDVERARKQDKVAQIESDSVSESGDAKSSDALNNTTNSTKGIWNQFLHAISGQIKIVKYDQELNANNAMSINQHKLDILKLRVEAIRLILLREDLQMFRNELQLTSHWINANLDTAQAKKLQLELDKLMKLEFPEIPALRSPEQGA